MARFNREFLVPYLREICALHLTQEKLNAEWISLGRQISSLQRRIPEVKRPVYTKEDTYSEHMMTVFGGSFLLAILAVFLVGIIKVPLDMYGIHIEHHPIAIFLLTLVSSLVFFFPKVKEPEESYQNKVKRKRYEEESARAREIEKEVSVKIGELERKRNAISAEYSKADRILNKAYSVNIIPNRYRDIYTAVYLYDWFGSSRADDLDMALSLFVLEEIKSKLDVIIENQSEMILNQQIMIANQYKAYEQREYHAQMLRSKLNRIAATNEERNMYLSMIETNTEATAFFAAANYLKY